MISHRLWQTYTQKSTSVDRPEAGRFAQFCRWGLFKDLFRMPDAENKNSAPTVAEFPEPADLLNKLKAQRKKSRADLADVEALLKILGSQS
ncbi:hypothetical protein QUB08_21355 [Microcoleus sp. BR0-C5]|uniref:hypothetical protein n=1 Tax=Microcoleus sp. BR0-C5 TaxID=2818713 RepID=UPI002FD0AC15